MNRLRTDVSSDEPSEEDIPVTTPPDHEPAAKSDLASATRRSPAMGRLVTFAIALSALVALAAGWGLATAFQSSAQREAATTPPSSSPILATVSTGNLVRQTAFSGVVVAENEESLTLAVPTGALRSVVTGHPVDKGATVDDGDVLTEVNGRPVFVIGSSFPFYRDVGFGDRGPDVEAIQNTLDHLGYAVDVDGQFGSQTESAVRDWYAKNGYVPATRNGEGDTEAASSHSESGDESGRTGDEANADRPTITAFVPVAEMLGVKTLPSISLTGLAVGAPVGSDGATDISLGSTTTKVTFDAAPADLAHITHGDEVTIEADGSSMAGRVTGIEQNTMSDSGSQDGSPGEQPESEGSQNSTVTVIPAEPLETSSSRIRVVSEQVIVDEQALLVPAIAVIDRGGDHQIVVVARPDGDFVEVEVAVLGTLDGKAAVVPKSSSSLRTGDEVRVADS